MRLMDPRARRRFKKNRSALVGLGIVALLMVFAAVGPYFAHHDPYVSDFVRGAGEGGVPVPPGARFWLGTDRLFRDVFVRLAYGARVSLFIAIASTVIATVIGSGLGVIAGFYEGSVGLRVPYVTVAGVLLAVVLLIGGHSHAAGGALVLGVALGAAARVLKVEQLARGPGLNADTALMRVVDIGLSFPFLLLVMALGAAFDRTSATTILWTLGLTSWLTMARVVRAKTLQVRALDFVTAARALGQRVPSIMVRHVLPNVAGPIIVLSTAQVAQMIVAESVLSYLGVGISPPTPTWGHMLFEGQDNYIMAPWLLIAPSIAILLSVLGFNMVGEGLRDALDPKED